jgi:hypothetical protein
MAKSPRVPPRNAVCGEYPSKKRQDVRAEDPPNRGLSTETFETSKKKSGAVNQRDLRQPQGYSGERPPCFYVISYLHVRGPVVCLVG